LVVAKHVRGCQRQLKKIENCGKEWGKLFKICPYSRADPISTRVPKLQFHLTQFIPEFQILGETIDLREKLLYISEKTVKLQLFTSLTGAPYAG